MRLTDRGKANTVLREQRTLCFPLADLDTFGKGRSAGCGARRREKVTGCVGSTHPVVLRMTHERTEHGEGRLELDRRQELACAPAFSGRGWFRTPGAGIGAPNADSVVRTSAVLPVALRPLKACPQASSLTSVELGTSLGVLRPFMGRSEHAGVSSCPDARRSGGKSSRLHPGLR